MVRAMKWAALSVCVGLPKNTEGFQVARTGEYLHGGCKTKSSMKSDWYKIEDDSIAKWQMRVASESQNCTVQEDAEGKKRRIVIDYFAEKLNEEHTCAVKQTFVHIENKGYFCEDLEDGVLSDTVEYQADNRYISYEYNIPKDCQAGGKKAPCPVLVSLPANAGVSANKCVLADSKCRGEQGVVAIFPTLNKEIEGLHDDKHCEMEDLEWLRSLVQDFTKEHKESVDSNRIMLFGQSAGATAAVWGAFRSPDIFSKVYASSPKTFWREAQLKGCNKTGIRPEKYYDEFLSVGKPIWQERAAKQKLKLNTFVVFVGSQDMNADEDGRAKFETLPNMIKDFQLVESGIKTEIRPLIGLEHRADVASFNELYDTIWRGNTAKSDAYGPGEL